MMPERHTKRLVCACGLRATVISDSAATVEGITNLVMREHPCDRLLDRLQQEATDG